jgi:diguanylate cyclase (GGDEF)-like protein
MDLTSGLLASMALAGWAAHAYWMHRRVQRARRDPLTGLLTRSGWTRRAQRIIRDPNAVVVLLDLDQFKTVNDAHGHHTGDAVLIATAVRLTAWCGSTGVAGRIGGDEFVAVLVISGQDTATRIAALHADIARPISTPGQRLSVGASIGYATTRGRPEADLPRLLRLADAAMYEAKSTGSSHCTDRDSVRAAAAVSANGRRRGRLGTHRERRSEVAA